MFNTYKRKFEELERLRKVSNARNFTEGLIIGASVGLLAGILFAPKKGKDSRDMICDGAKRIGDQVISVVPMLDCCCMDDCCYDEDCCDEDCCDDGEFCCEGDDCCIGDECSDDYEIDYENENFEEELDPTDELESEK